MTAWPRSLMGQMLLAVAAALLLVQGIGAILVYRAQAERREAGLLHTAAFRLLSAARDTVMQVGAEVWHGPVAYALHGFKAPAFWLTLAGFLLATVMYWWKPELPAKARAMFAWPVRVLENKYGLDKLWIDGFAGGGLALGKVSRAIDTYVIDGAVVNGSARVVDLVARLTRRMQSGYLYHYAFAMILGLIALLAVLIRFWR